MNAIYIYRIPDLQRSQWTFTIESLEIINITNISESFKSVEELMQNLQ